MASLREAEAAFYRTAEILEDHTVFPRRELPEVLASSIFGPKIVETAKRMLAQEQLKFKIFDIGKRFPETNLALSAVDSAIVGPELYPHNLQRESYLHILNWNPKVLSGEQLGTDDYTDGVQEAIKRGNPYYLVVEQPPKDKPCSPDQWEDYVEKVARFYNSATFIIGNEINVPQHFDSYLPPEEYAEMFLRARRAIKKVAPGSKVSLYGEAYYGKGEVLGRVLELLEEKKSQFGLRPDEKPYDTVAVHHYDSAKELSNKIRQYQQILGLIGNPRPKIVVSEIGIHLEEEKKWQLDEKDRAIIMVQNLAICADLVRRGDVEAGYWFSMFSFSDTEDIHGLYQQHNNEIIPTRNVIPFLLTNRLLRKVTGFSVTPTLTLVSGETIYQRGWQRRPVKTKVIWNNTFSEEKILVPSRAVVYNLYGEIGRG